MAYVPTESFIVAQPIAESSATPLHALGTIVRAKDPTYGAGEFIYLLGVSGTLVGSCVKYNATTFQTALVTNTAEQANAVAWAMSDNTDGKYGWYQIAGLAVALKTAVLVTAQVPVYLSGTAGRVKVIASEGKGIQNCRSANLASVTSTTSTVILQINRPTLQGFRSA